MAMFVVVTRNIGCFSVRLPQPPLVHTFKPLSPVMAISSLFLHRSLALTIEDPSVFGASTWPAV